MTVSPVAKLSKIEFRTDMTRKSGLIIPLGFLLEVTWENQARWLGMIGRTHLTPIEADLVHGPSKQELENPWKFLADSFDSVCEEPWGTACDHLANRYAWALNFSRPEPTSAADTLTVETDDAWIIAQNHLSGDLLIRGRTLRPAAIAPVIQFPQPIPAPVPVPATRPSTKVSALAA